MAIKYGTSGPDVLVGTADVDDLFGLGGNDRLYGLASGDRLDGGTGRDTMAGGAGDDTYQVDDPGDQVIEQSGEGNDVVTTTTSWVATPGSEIEVLQSGTNEAIALTGNAHSDAYSMEIRGGNGNDRLDDGGGRSNLYGGFGNDTYVVTNPLTFVFESDGSDIPPGHGPDAPPPPPPDPLLEGVDTVRTNLASYGLPDNVENLTRFGSGDFYGVGNREANLMIGAAGNDTLDGGDGNDTLNGGVGRDLMDGGDGDDTYFIDSAGDRVRDRSGTDTAYVSAPWVLPADLALERVILTGTANLAFTGNAYAMRIDGNAGANSLDDGGAADSLVGGAGTDRYNVHNTATKVYEFAGGGFDTVTTDLAAYTAPANVEVLTFTGTGPFRGTGNIADNIITGGTGNDTLDGAAGADRLVGGTGNDTYLTDQAGDYVVEKPGEGYDTVLTTAARAQAAPNVEELDFTGSGDFTGFANATGTVIKGGGGNDALFGGAGNDTLDGSPLNLFIGSNHDTLFGGAGADSFVLHPLTGLAYERILDFTPGTDTLAIDDPYAFSDLASFTTTQPQPYEDTGGHNIGQIYYYDQPAGKLYYVDSNDPQAHATLLATFDNRPTLTLSDFTFTHSSGV